jgi:hypothetical protein
LLHELSSQAYQQQSLFQGDYATGDQGGVFSQAVPSEVGGLNSKLVFQGLVHGHFGCQNGWLCE